MNIINTTTGAHLEEVDKSYSISRRRFFQLTGGIAGAGALLSASSASAGAFSPHMGKGDTALLNFLYITQQVEAAFYTEAVAQLSGSLHVSSLAALLHVRDQEAAHTIILRDMLGSRALHPISTDFSAVAFSDLNNVLHHAGIIEDMAVAALNGAAGFFREHGNSMALSRIALTDAAHASIFGTMLSASSVSELQIGSYLDDKRTPQDVLTIAEQYTQTRFDKSNLPNHLTSSEHGPEKHTS